MNYNGSRKIRRKQVCRWKTRLRNFRLRKFRRSQILHPQYLLPTLYTPFHRTLPRTFTYRTCPFGVHCLSPIRQNFLRRVFLRQTCLRRIFRTLTKTTLKYIEHTVRNRVFTTIIGEQKNQKYNTVESCSATPHHHDRFFTAPNIFL